MQIGEEIIGSKHQYDQLLLFSTEMNNINMVNNLFLLNKKAEPNKAYSIIL